MPVSGVALKVARKKFFEEIVEKYNTSNEEIARILVNAGHSGYKAENEPQYRIIIDAFFKESERQKEKTKEVKERIANAADKAGEWRRVIFPEPERLPCPINDCGGIRLRGRVGSQEWYCSKGGRRHFNALKVAEMWAAVNRIEEDQLINDKATHFTELEDWNVSLEETKEEVKEEVCN